ncbi:hypothetical protein ACQEU3_27440 [Spirillospora sp. CA-253888]
MLNRIADRMVSAAVPKATASAACTPGYFTQCSNRLCRISGVGTDWRERWYRYSDCSTVRTDPSYACNC